MIDIASSLQVSNFIDIHRQRQPTTASVDRPRQSTARVSRCLRGRYYEYVIS